MELDIHGRDIMKWRRQAALCALIAFTDASGGSLEHEMKDMIGDLLCNLGHLCDSHNLDWEELVERARRNIEHERKHPND